MTISARNWAWDVTEYVDQRTGAILPIKSGMKLVLLCIAEHENAESGYSFPGIDRIRTRTCLSKTSVNTNLGLLRQAGLVATYAGLKYGGKWARNEYVLPVPEEYRAKDELWQQFHE